MNRKNYLTKSWKSDRRSGAAALEFAVVAPALLLVIFSAFEFSKVAIIRSLAHCAAYESARHGVVEGATRQEVIDEAERILARMGTKNYNINVNGGTELSSTTESVEVYIEVPMADNVFLLSTFFNDRWIVAETTLRTERYTGYYDGSVQ